MNKTMIFTGERSYKEIWEISAKKVSEKYDLNYPKLLKKCKEYNIQIPTSKYWTYLQMGKDLLKDKKIYLEKIDANGGKGDSQNNCINDAYKLNLRNENWYVFNDNYGTSEKKLFIKYFKSTIEPKLQSKGLEYYVVRNERIHELAIYSFSAGERFEPDFLLFVRKKEMEGSLTY